MNPEEILEQLRNHFLVSGFNITLFIDVNKYDQTHGVSKKIKQILPEANSLILVGFGGNTFWEVFQKYLLENPSFRDGNIDLIDNYSILKMNETSQIFDSNHIRYTFSYPFGENALDLNFLKLGELSGAGVPSLLGILLHPSFGPWISLRGAIITNMEFAKYDEPLSNFSPCPSCDKPCISACPINTISETGWDWESCMKFRLRDETCSSSCASRRACPYGQDKQYSEKQLYYHHKFVLKSVRKYYE